MSSRRKPSRSPLQPGLFDNLDNFVERQDSGFEFIPSGRMEEIARMHAGRNDSAIDDMAPLEVSDELFFMSFGSGSSGNCSYLGDRRGGFLIDAGVDAKNVTASLTRNGIDMKNVGGIILTHDHHDHISQAYALLRANRHMRLYCTPKAFNGILRRHSVSRRIKDYHTPVYKEFTFRIGAFDITPFEVMHDGADNAGFFITHGSRTVAIATDLGCISPRVDHYMRQAETIVIEANYDLQMLVSGSYPEHLKARIKAANGHMDNSETAAFLAAIHTDRLRNIFLCHLSHDNNTPSRAYRAVTDALAGIGVTRIGDLLSLPADSSSLAPQINVIPLPRYESTHLYTL